MNFRTLIIEKKILCKFELIILWSLLYGVISDNIFKNIGIKTINLA